MRVPNLALLLYAACFVAVRQHRDVSNSAGKLEKYGSCPSDIFLYGSGNNFCFNNVKVQLVIPTTQCCFHKILIMLGVILSSRCKGVDMRKNMR